MCVRCPPGFSATGSISTGTVHMHDLQLPNVRVILPYKPVAGCSARTHTLIALPCHGHCTKILPSHHIPSPPITSLHIPSHPSLRFPPSPFPSSYHTTAHLRFTDFALPHRQVHWYSHRTRDIQGASQLLKLLHRVLSWLAHTLCFCCRFAFEARHPSNQIESSSLSESPHRTAPAAAPSLVPDHDHPKQPTSNHQAPPIHQSARPPAGSYQQTILLAQTRHHHHFVFGVENCDRACLLELLRHLPDCQLPLRPSALSRTAARQNEVTPKRPRSFQLHSFLKGPLSFLCGRELEREKRGDWKCCGETKDGFAEPAQLVPRRSGTAARPAGV
jgi:hypothetical protein